jgi:hypothetical protein
LALAAMIWRFLATINMIFFCLSQPEENIFELFRVNININTHSDKKRRTSFSYKPTCTVKHINILSNKPWPFNMFAL